MRNQVFSGSSLSHWPTAIVWGMLAISSQVACIGAEPEYDRRQVPGTVIYHIPADTKVYVGSPGIVRLEDGTYVAKCDEFGPNSMELTGARTVVFRSDDQGKTWNRISTLDGMYWSTLFRHRGSIYLLGTDRQFGKVVISKSTDDGTSWTTPSDAKSGLLIADGHFHCAPVPVIEHDGRLWRAMEEYRGETIRNRRFGAFMMSIDADADLLDADSWVQSNRLEDEADWLDGKVFGWLEGNAVVAPDGGIVDMLRVHRHVDEKAAIISISRDGKTATFDPESGFVDFPGGSKKFTIRYDPQSKRYWSLSNYLPPEFAKLKPTLTRNTLALISSPDLRNWRIDRIVLQHPDVEVHGFQYADWLFEGDDIVAVVRTAYDDESGGAHTYHDANYLTFHRITNFRSSPPFSRDE